ncbi:dihydroxyacetone kinase phosphoryl donor subunit DhaM [Motilibacter peucedani]|uniref:dihydroxyacetone kinase phosphoryl donor subunit DhaM n=1 Tax=Motilibacter peucedani TaxID=598650 RepID=UPI0016025470|nr:dihydroxyacetone kinase phosphoryl donor subunit DhaM [Motilibacter peucedani]
MADGVVARVGLVVVSHVAGIADGVAELARQMAPDVLVLPAGGTDDGGVGTSFDRVLTALEQASADASGVVVTYDLGSALLTTETALELLDDDVRRLVTVVDAPLVEGTLAAAVAAQGRAGVQEVVAAAAGLAQGAAPEAGDDAEERTTLVLVNPLGLHARPAAAVARALAGLDARTTLGRPGGPGVDARSVLGVVGLALRGGDEVDLRVSGPDAATAVRTVAELVEQGFGELDGPPEPAPSPGRTSDAASTGPDFSGTAASPGVAAGPLVHLGGEEPHVPERTAAEIGSHSAAEGARLQEALRTLDARLAASSDDVVQAHRALLADPALAGTAQQLVAGGASAASAWWRVVGDARAVLAGGDEVVAGRAADVLDVGLQVLALLDPSLDAALPPAERLAGAVVVAADLLPSQVPQLAEAGVAGVATAGGARTAHASLLARGLGLPMVVGLGGAVLGLEAGVPAVLDGTAGRLTAPADPAAVAEAHERRAAAERERHEAQAAAAAPVVLPDGRRVEVRANVASVAEARAAREAGADGVGLLRTELMFLDRAELPGEEEQAAGLAAVFAALDGAPVVVRTLDVGGDKQLPALRLDPVRHGFLGERGLRHGLAHPEVLRTQVRAVLRAAASTASEVALMAPMVTFADEAQAFRDVVERAGAELQAEGAAYALPSALGVMVEVPAAALAVDELAAVVDFVSVGTNDLVQYLVAAERTLPEVAGLYRPDATAVWRTLEQVVAGARRGGCRVAVCGELAGDPETAARLVALGVDELSMAPVSVAAVKAALRP